MMQLRRAVTGAFLTAASVAFLVIETAPRFKP
jgi:hypothetical protein